MVAQCRSLVGQSPIPRPAAIQTRKGTTVSGCGPCPTIPHQEKQAILETNLEGLQCIKLTICAHPIRVLASCA